MARNRHFLAVPGVRLVKGCPVGVAAPDRRARDGLAAAGLAVVASLGHRLPVGPVPEQRTVAAMRALVVRHGRGLATAADAQLPPNEGSRRPPPCRVVQRARGWTAGRFGGGAVNIAKAAIGQPTAAVRGAGFLWFPGHDEMGLKRRAPGERDTLAGRNLAIYVKHWHKHPRVRQVVFFGTARRKVAAYPANAVNTASRTRSLRKPNRSSSLVGASSPITTRTTATSSHSDP
jgi:hypothetical protein